MSRSRYPNSNCPTCRRPIGPDDAVESCARCESSWHAWCWRDQGGCGTAGCPNGSRSSATKPRPSREAAAATSVAVEAAGAGSHVESSPAGPLPRAARRHKVSARPWYVASTVVLAGAVLLTIVISTVATQRRQAKADLERLIEEARAAGGPERVAATLEDYLADPPRGRVATIASAALAEAKREIDEADFRQLHEIDTGPDTDLARLEATLQGYLAKHPGGTHRQEVENRLRAIPQDRDDQAYRRASEQTRVAGDDISRQKAAWEAYLRDYPNGRNAAKARASIAGLPEREDDLRLARLKKEVDALVKADRLTEALLRVDRGLAELRTSSRRQALAKIGQQVEATLEHVDAARCLQPAGPSPLDREQRLRECRLYLLCYPAGDNREKVSAQIGSILEAQREDGVRQLRRRLDALQENPDAALRIIAESLRDGSIPLSAVADEIIRLHGARLQRSLDASLAGLKTILLNDGTELVGTVKSENSTTVQLELRVAAGSSIRKSRLLVRNQIASISEPPPKTEWERIRERWPKANAQKLANSTFLAGIRKLRSIVTADDYRPEWEACQIFLAALDPSDQDARETAARLGLVETNGALLPAVAPRLTASGHDNRRQMLERLAPSFRAKASTAAQSFLPRLPSTYEFTLYSTKLDVPVEWNLGGCSAELLPADAGEAVGSIKFRFPLTLSRDASLALPESVAERVDREIQDVNRQIEFEIEHEVQAISSRARGIGVKLKNRGDEVIVGEVVPDTPADGAGLLVGDRLCRVGDEWVELGQQADAVAARFAVSAGSISLIVMRQDRRFLVDVELREFETTSYQARDRLNVRVDVLGKRIAGREWSEWSTINGAP